MNLFTRTSNSYQKDGATVVSVRLSGNYDAVAIQHESDELAAPLKIIAGQGRLTRAERRKVVKVALLCFRFGKLHNAKDGEFKALGGKTRYVFLNLDKTEVQQ